MKMTVDLFKFYIAVACRRLFMLLEGVEGKCQKAKRFQSKGEEHDAH